ncbi:helix-turn-helix domain-containing protein [Microbacterium sp. P02]|uniref:helix-turn-helix domain-containing protein n=1 Tax=Microbacterium sp. P02 TaxID=3366260 RepID=UPI00366AC5CA
MPKVTVQQAAEEWQVDPKTVRRWIAAGIVSAERVGPRLIRVDLNSLKSRPLQYIGGDGA